MCGGEFIDVKKVIELHASISQVRVRPRLGGTYAIFRSGVSINEKCNRILVCYISAKLPKVGGAYIILFSNTSTGRDAPHTQVWGINVDNKQAWTRVHNKKVLHGDTVRFSAMLEIRQKAGKPQ